jgi:hypothetical protein
VTQAVYDVTSTKSLLSDYHSALQALGKSPLCDHFDILAGRFDEDVRAHAVAGLTPMGYRSRCGA